jgi:hypothetical protein
LSVVAVFYTVNGFMSDYQKGYEAGLNDRGFWDMPDDQEEYNRGMEAGVRERERRQYEGEQEQERREYEERERDETYETRQARRRLGEAAGAHLDRLNRKIKLFFVVAAVVVFLLVRGCSK